MKKIGVISDTHLNAEHLNSQNAIFKRLEFALTHYFQDIDVLIHAGDFGSPDLLQFLQESYDVVWVKGNIDSFREARDWPLYREIKIEGTKIAISHQRKDLFPHINPEISVYIFGHSHQWIKEVNEVGIWLNPGSIKRPASKPPQPSIAKIRIENTQEKKEHIQVQHYFLDNT